MSKRWLINYLLIFLIILFGWLGKPITDPETVTKSILSAEPQDIKEIRIETKNEVLTFKKPLTRWYFTSPIKWPASDVNLNRIASLVNLEPHSSLPSSEIDISTLGLRFPNTVITLNKDVIVFGDSNQIGSRRYLLVNDTVHLVADNHLPLTTAGLTGFINKSLLPKPITLTQLKLPQFTLSRTDSASWSVDKPVEGYSADQSNQLINNWQTLESTNIKPYENKSTPLKKIIAQTSDGEIEFYLLSIQPEVVLARADLGVEYHFDDSYYYDLFSLQKQKMPLKTPQSAE